MELYQKQAEFAKNVSKLLQYIFTTGHLVTFGEAYRTPEQARIDAQEGKGIVDSLHCRRLAIDLNIFSSDGVYLKQPAPYKQIGEYWKTLNVSNRWGGDFPKLQDANHFEMQDN
jgi:hypothetical protein